MVRSTRAGREVRSSTFIHCPRAPELMLIVHWLSVGVDGHGGADRHVVLPVFSAIEVDAAGPQPRTDKVLGTAGAGGLVAHTDVTSRAPVSPTAWSVSHDSRGARQCVSGHSRPPLEAPPAHGAAAPSGRPAPVEPPGVVEGCLRRHGGRGSRSADKAATPPSARPG